MSTLMINSKVRLGCNICDKCCINRGDIKVTPINVIEISRFMKISIKDFLENYTIRLENQPIEIVIKAVGEKNRCILNDEKTNMCIVHKVKPMQCVTFPLIPIDLEHDIFYNQDTCECAEKKEMRVIDWLNGKKGIYVKYKKVYIEWIELVESIQKKWELIDKNIQEEIFDILFYKYEDDVRNVKKTVKNNFKIVKKILKNYHLSE